MRGLREVPLCSTAATALSYSIHRLLPYRFWHSSFFAFYCDDLFVPRSYTFPAVYPTMIPPFNLRGKLSWLAQDPSALITKTEKTWTAIRWLLHLESNQPGTDCQSVDQSKPMMIDRRKRCQKFPRGLFYSIVEDIERRRRAAEADIPLLFAAPPSWVAPTLTLLPTNTVPNIPPDTNRERKNLRVKISKQ